MSNSYLCEIEIARLRQRVAELEAERDRLREVVREQADALREAMRVADEDNTDECLSYDEAELIEAALRAALEVK